MRPVVAYESGTKSLDVAKDGTITEKGFFLPVDSSASAPHWASDGRTVYVIDCLRGIDVLTFDSNVAKGGPAKLHKQALTRKGRDRAEPGTAPSSRDRYLTVTFAWR